MVSESFKTVILGIDTVYVGEMKIIEKEVFVKKRKWIFFTNWVHLLGNVEESLKKFEERTLFDVSSGRTEEQVRVYWYDLDTLKEYTPKSNVRLLREIQVIREQSSYFKSLYVQAIQFMKDHNILDGFKNQIKSENDFARSLKSHEVQTYDAEEKKVRKNG